MRISASVVSGFQRHLISVQTNDAGKTLSIAPKESGFGAEGEPGSNFTYSARVKADASPDVIRELLRHTDQVAEIQNTLRKGLSVRMIEE